MRDGVIAETGRAREFRGGAAWKTELRRLRMKLLHIDSSILGQNSVSRTLTTEIVEAQRRLHPGLEVIYHDVAEEPLLHLSGLHLAAAQAGVPEHAQGLQHDLARSEAALDEFLGADIIVVGAPMYNFGIPSQLKAWIDRIAVAGKTFRYSENGIEGLAGGRKVIVASSRGGIYAGDTPMAALDHQETYLRSVFSFIGITDIEFVRAEGVSMGPDARGKALESARAAIALQAA
jgi:FMN-dependent NADH-azoreductase